MKTEYKAVIASVVVIALCLCAVGGVTYSWFSDSDQAEIDISTAKVDVDLTINTIAPEPGSLGTASIDSGNINISNMAPGDTFSGTYNIDNNSTIRIAYRLYLSIDETTYNSLSTDFKQNLSISADGNSSVPLSDATKIGNNYIVVFVDWTKLAAGADRTNRELQISMSGNLTDQTTTGLDMAILIEAYQSNADILNGVTGTVSSGNNEFTVRNPSSDDSSVFSTATISFESNSDTNEVLTVVPVTEDNYDYSLADDQTFLAGVEVTSSNGGNALQGVKTNVSMVVEDNLPKELVKIYHKGVEFTPNDLTATYDSSADSTTVSFSTTDGFSTYAITTEAQAIVNGTYAELTNILQGNVTLLKDISWNTFFVNGDTLDLDLNGHTISILQFNVSKTAMIHDGTITSTSKLAGVSSGGSLTLSNVEITTGAAITVGSSSSNDTNKLILDNVTANFNYVGVIGGKNSHITVNGGTFNSTIGVVFQTSGTAGVNGQNWSFDDATFNVSVEDPDRIGVAIQCHNDGTWTISNCTFNMDRGVALSVRGGDVTVSNCEYNYTNSGNGKETAQVEGTDVAIDVTVPYAIAAWHNLGSYGCTSEDTLTIDNAIQTLDISNDAEVQYFNF